MVLDAASWTSPPKIRGRSGSFVPLQRYECIRVAKKIRRNGHRFYVAAVFLQRSAARRRLSEGVYKTLPAFMMTEREPDFVVEHRFSEFRQLRNDIVALPRANGTHVKVCTDCQDLLCAMLRPNHRNWTLKRMFGNKEQRFALLTTFVDDLLTLTVSVGEHTISGSGMEKDCSIREQVAEMLQEFLKPSYQPSLGII
ncbi:unnamed protein product [Peronospora destructor]|uniref:PX domain-containing protein n=1 Tax=Peronospora destructor TaxID=86335 RepID=A0AAV0V5N8_9STRA|nr:unnamed protein product [Peronospora destructor]